MTAPAYPRGLDAGLSRPVEEEESEPQFPTLETGPSVPMPAAPAPPPYRGPEMTSPDLFYNKGLPAGFDENAATVGALAAAYDPGMFNLNVTGSIETLMQLARVVVLAAGEDHPELLAYAKEDLMGAARIVGQAELYRRFFGATVPSEWIPVAIDAVRETVSVGYSTQKLIEEIGDREDYRFRLNEPFESQLYTTAQERAQLLLPQSWGPVGEGEAAEASSIEAASRFLSNQFAGVRLGDVVAGVSDDGRRILFTVAGGPWRKVGADALGALGVPHEQPRYVDVLLDEGVTVGTKLDALAAFGDAVSGAAHQIQGMSDPDHVADIRHAMGMFIDNNNAWVNQALGEVEQFLGFNVEVTTVSTADARRAREAPGIQKKAEELKAASDAARTSDIGVVALVAQEMYRQNPSGGVQDAVARSAEWVLAASPDVRAEINAGIANLTSLEDFVAEAQAAGDQRSSLERLVNESQQWAMDQMATYGRFIDWFGTHLIDVGADALQGSWAFMQGVLQDAGVMEYEGPSGADAFRATWDWTQANSLSEYTHLEGAAGMWLDLGANLLFDPLMWIAPGAKALRKRYHAMITDPARVGAALNKPAVRQILGGVERGMGKGDFMPLLVSTKGMNGRHFEALYEAGKAKDAKALTLGWQRALPAAGDGGTWLPDFSGRLMLRNTSGQVARMAGLANTDTGSRELLVRMMGGFPRDRKMSVAPGMMIDEFGDGIVWTLFTPERAAASTKGAALGTEFANDADYWISEMMKVQRTVLGPADFQRGVAQMRLDSAIAKSKKAKATQPADVKAWIRQYMPARSVEVGSARNLDELEKMVLSAESRVAAIDAQIDLLRGRPSAAARVAELEAERAAISSDRWARFQELSTRERELSDQFYFSKQAAKIGKKEKPVAPQEVIDERAAIMKELAELRGEPMIRGFASADDAFRELMVQHRAYLDTMAEVGRDRAAALRALQATQRGPNRDPIANLYARYDDWYGETYLHLDRTGPYDEVLGKQGLDWSPVTGDERRVYSTENVSQMWPLLAGEDLKVSPELAAGLRATDLFNKQSWYYRPASLMQMNAYEFSNYGTAKWWTPRSWVASGVRGPSTKAGEAADAVGRAVQRTFGTVILVPRTSVKSAFDEWGRLGISRGWQGIRHPVTGLDPITGAVQVGEKGIPGPLTGVWRSYRKGGITGRLGEGSQRAAREAEGMVVSPLGSDSMTSGWRLVGPEGADVKDWSAVTPDIKAQRTIHRDAVTEWFHGSAGLGSEGHVAWANTVVDTADDLGVSVAEVLRRDPSEWSLDRFAEWYESGGALDVSSYVVKVGDTAEVADIITHATSVRNAWWGMFIRNSTNESFIDDTIRRLAKGREGRYVADRAADERMIRMWGPMPSAQVRMARHGVLGKAQDVLIDAPFRGMYGTPGTERYGAFHALFYDDAIRPLEEAHRRAGTMLNAERLAEIRPELGIDGAIDLMRTRPESVARIAYEHHLVTPDYLHMVADKQARNRAAHLMYQPGATSMLGNKVQRVSPFGPAQFDWVSWYANEGRKAATIGLFGKHFQVPNFLNLKAMMRGTPVGALPVNLRLLARVGEVGGGLADYTKDKQENQPAEGGIWDKMKRLSPYDIYNDVTFFPDVTDPTQFMIDMGPGLGPIPSWMIRLLPQWEAIDSDDPFIKKMVAGIRDVVSTLQPAMDFTNSGFGAAGLLNSFFNSVLPNYPGSPRNLLMSGIEGIGRLPRLFGDGYFSGEWGDLPPAYEYAFAYTQEEDAMNVRWKPYTRGYVGGTYADVTPVYSEEAMGRALSQEWLTGAARSLTLARAFLPYDDIAVPHWAGFVDQIPDLLTRRLVSKYDATDVKRLWGKYLDGTASVTDLRELKTVLYGMFFDLGDHAPARTVYATGHGPDEQASLEALLGTLKPGTEAYARTQKKLDDMVIDLAYPAQAEILVRHSELTGRSVGFYSCVFDGAGFVGPEGMCTTQGRPNYADDSKTAERQLDQGLAGGWFVKRAPWERQKEFDYRQARARLELLTYGYQTIFGRKRWDPEGLPSSVVYDKETGTSTMLNLRAAPEEALEALRLVGVFGGELPNEVPTIEFLNELVSVRKGMADIPSPWVRDGAIPAKLANGDPMSAHDPGTLSGEWFVNVYLPALEERALDEGWGAHPSEYPFEVLAEVHGFADALIKRQAGEDRGVGAFKLEDWNVYYAPTWGPIDWEPPSPPVSLDDPDIETSITLSASEVEVIDGDTLSVRQADGTVRMFRLIGVNAPDRPMEGWADAWGDLESLLHGEGYKSVSLVVWQPEIYGTEAGRDSVGAPRIKVWLYVDGVPVYNERVFTHRNPQGIGRGGDYVPLPRPGGVT